MTADAVRFLVKDPVVITEFVEAVGSTQSGGACSDDDDLHIHTFRGGEASEPEGLSLWIQARFPGLTTGNRFARLRRHNLSISYLTSRVPEVMELFPLQIVAGTGT